MVVPSGTEATARYLADLPIRLLGLVGGVDDDLVLLFQRLGLYHLGDLAALEDADVLARFAAPGRFARRLAAGVDERLPDAHDPPGGLAVEHHFDEPVHHADIVVFTARRLADGLVGHLGADGRVCIRAHVTIETEHGERSERLWYRSTGLVAAAIVERTRWQLDGWANSEALTAGITLLRLDPVEIRADDGVQQGMWGGRTQADDWALRAVARLAGIVGEEHVVVPAARGGRLVHDQYTWVSASTVELAEGEARVRPPVEPWPGRNTGPSPAVVHDPPVVIQVHDAAGTPVQVSGRGQLSAPPAAVLVGGHWLAVRYWAGPWPVEQRWWDAATHRRVARFQLLTDDQRLFDVGLEDRRWWMHAEHA